MRRRLIQATLLAPMLGTLAACGALPALPTLPSLPGLPGEDKRLQGVWTVERAQLGTSNLTPQMFGARLLLGEGSYEFQGDRGEFRVLPNSNPAAMDIVGRSGPNAGRTIPAIFERKGDLLIVCYDLGGRSRPTAFDSPAGAQWLLVRYIRNNSPPNP
jgi:uncharacterized protein (TIGR03067 family)